MSQRSLAGFNKYEKAERAPDWWLLTNLNTAGRRAGINIGIQAGTAPGTQGGGCGFFCKWMSTHLRTGQGTQQGDQGSSCKWMNTLRLSRPPAGWAQHDGAAFRMSPEQGQAVDLYRDSSVLVKDETSAQLLCSQAHPALHCRGQERALLEGW